jgi:hypothetical protein
LSDLILHYRDVDFHGHKVILYQHCTYFRAVIPGLQPESVSASDAESASSAAAQRLPRSSSPSSNSDSSPSAKRARCSQPISLQLAQAEPECTHPFPVACLQLPHSFGIKPVSTDSLQLFLEHVYFPHSYPFPPYVPNARVDLSTIEADASGVPLFPLPCSSAIAQ